MRRTMTVGIVLLGLPLASLAATSAPAGASGVDASTAAITCSGIHGKVSFDPPLTNTGITKETITFTETVSGCSPTDSVTVSKGAVSATLKTNLVSEGFSSACDVIGDASAFGTKSKGSIGWTSSPQLSSGATTFSVAPLHWTTDGSAQLNAVGWSFGSPAGSFQGPNHGEYDAIWADSTISSNAAYTDCMSGSGLSKLKLQTPTGLTALTLGGPNPE